MLEYTSDLATETKQQQLWWYKNAQCLQMRTNLNHHHDSIIVSHRLELYDSPQIVSSHL
jgi:hypothetical protein